MTRIDPDPDEWASSVTEEEFEEPALQTKAEVLPPGGDDVLPTWKPTKKWLAALAGVVASVVSSWLVTGAFDDVERGMAAAGLVSLTAAYFKGNDPTPGGVPNER